MKKDKNAINSKVIWITNLPAPYRVPIWNQLSTRLDLKVVSLMGEKNWRNWKAPKHIFFEHVFLSKKVFRIREYDLIPSILGVKKLVSEGNVIILGGWESPFYLAALVFAKHLKIPVIGFYESTVSTHRFNWSIIKFVRFRFFSNVDYVVTPGEESTRAVRNMGVDNSKIVTLFNPVDVEWFAKWSSHKASISPGAHRYLYVGQLIQRKNLNVLIESFANIATESDKLTIVGSGPLLRKLQDLASKLGIDHQVEFMGQQSQKDLVAIYAISDTLVLPSREEVWGLVVNEALACGLHVVVSNSAGVSSLVKDMA